MIISVDIVVLLFGILVVGELKRRYPNFCFLARGANVFLPPQQQKQNKDQQPQQQSAPLTNNNKNPRKQYSAPHKQSKKIYPIKFIQAELDAFKPFPLFQQYEKVFLLMVLLLFHMVVTNIFRVLPFLPDWFRTQSSLPVIVYILLTLYAFYYSLKIITHNGIKADEFKASFLVVLVLLAVYSIVAYAFEPYTDTALSIAVKSETRHLKMLLPSVFDSKQDISCFTVQFCIITISCILTLVNVPAVMKYGNAYTELLKEVYLQEEGQQQAEKPAAAIESQARLKLSCERKLKIFNIEMILSVAVLLLWGIPQVRKQISDPLFVYGRAWAVGLLSFINILTYKDEIEIHLATSFKYLRGFQQTEQKTEDLLKLTQRKVYSYIYYFWYPCYQLMFKIILPMLLLLMLLNRSPYSLLSAQTSPVPYEEIKYHYEIANTLVGNTTTKINLDTSCGLIRDPILTLKNLYKCSGNSHLDFKEAGINGWQLSLQDSSVHAVVERVSNYGLFSSVFEYQVLEYILWYVILSKYTLTVFYILFLRKTVMNM